MKNLFLLLCGLFTMNSAIGQVLVSAISHEVSAQSKYSVAQLQYANAPEYLQNIKRKDDMKIADIHPNTNLKKNIQLQTTLQGPLLQLFDSIYFWMKDEYSTELRLYSRRTPLVYDGNHHLISQLEQLWDGRNWTKGWLYTMTYDAHGNKTSFLHQTWDGSAWWDFEHDTYTYDDNNNQTSSLRQKWNGTNDCVNDEYCIYSYDANNNQISSIIQHWNGNSWENYALHTYTYDVNNNVISCLIQAWNGSWANGWLYSYAYDEKNNLLSLTYSLWYGDAWGENSLNTYIYDENNNLISDLYQEMHGTLWTNNSSKIYSYDVNNNLISKHFQLWDGNTWLNFEKEDNTYDANNNQTAQIIQSWDNNVWKKYIRHALTYDANNFTLSNSTQRWNTDGTLAFRDSTHYYFNTVVSAVDNLNEPPADILVYPNPATSCITIKTHAIPSENAYLVIYNAKGQPLLISQIKESTKVIDIGTLPHGFYLIKTFCDSEVRVFKLFKQ